MWLKQTDALTGFVAVFIGLITIGGIVFSAISREPDRTLVALVIQDFLFIGIPIAVGTFRASSKPWRVVGFTKFKPSAMWLVAGALLAQIVVTILYSLLISTPEQDSIVEDQGFTDTPLAAITAFTTIVILAPIGEEALFRGLFFGAIRSRAPFWVAAGTSGILFGLVHLTTGDAAVAGLLAFFGILLAWLYEKTGSIGPPIALHMINNAIAIIPLLF